MSTFLVEGRSSAVVVVTQQAVPRLLAARGGVESTPDSRSARTALKGVLPAKAYQGMTATPISTTDANALLAAASR